MSRQSQELVLETDGNMDLRSGRLRQKAVTKDRNALKVALEKEEESLKRC